MKAKFVNEGIKHLPGKSGDELKAPLLKEKERLLKLKEKAEKDSEEGEAKKKAFIEKYGQKAWDNNMSYYSDGYDAWKYAQMRYPGKAAWNGEGPIMRKINNADERVWSCEEKLKEVEEKLKKIDKGIKVRYFKYETANSREEEYMMEQLWRIIHEFVYHVGYGETLRRTSIKELTDDYFETYGDQLRKEQVEEIAAEVYNTVYLNAYKDDNGEWVFPER